MENLEARKQLILRAVIVEYIHSAEPIASELLTQKYDLGVKSATVRNELAEMSELGYLEQPHTSSGRIPSDKGYRYYVDHFLTQYALQPSSTAPLYDSTRAGEALQFMLQNTTKLLGRSAHLLAAATTVRGSGVVVRSALVSAFGPHQALFVIGLSNGEVLNKLVDCPHGLTLLEIGLVNESLALHTSQKPIRALLRQKPPSMAPGTLADTLMQSAWGALKLMAREFTRGTLITSGEEFLFGQPEFSREAGSLAELLEQVKGSDILFEAVNSNSPSTVTIGKENRAKALSQLSIVRQSFLVGNQEAGSIALIGPTRMHYDQSVQLVQWTASAISEALSLGLDDRP